jgi:ribosomal protein S18 acetylase RimI-like enzyme
VNQASSRSEVSGPRASTEPSPDGSDVAWHEGFQRTGRFLVVEDLSTIGCDTVLLLLEIHGLIGLFGLTADELARVDAAFQYVPGGVQFRQWALFHRPLHLEGAPVAGNPRQVGPSDPVDPVRSSPRRWLNAAQADAALRARACELMRRCGVDPPEDAMLQERAGGEFLCALDAAGEVLATGTVLPVHHPRGLWAGHAQLGTLAVRPDWRRTGLALELSERLMAAASARGDITALTAVASDDNPASQALLARLGFTRDPLRRCRMYFRDGVIPTR